MASIASDSSGRKRIMFFAPDGKRKTLWLGKASMKQAEAIKAKIEALVAAKLYSGAIDDETSRWLDGMGDTLAAKLAHVGLIPSRQTKARTLSAFLDGYLSSRTDAKAGTLLVLGQTRRCLRDFFGPGKALTDITARDADLWRLDLVKQGLADATIRRRCGIARQYFRAAMRDRLVSTNPFADLPTATQGNASRMFFIDRATADTILATCPTDEWKAIFSLCRFGGLRCPSEVLGLRWADVNWEHGRILVRSPKTARFAGKDSRLVPLFPELQSILLKVFHDAEPGEQHVVTRYRTTEATANLRTQFLRILARAGVKPWPRLFQNLRSSRQTELAESWPEYICCAWLGNSATIARKHYLQVRDEDFQRAATDSAIRIAPASHFTSQRESARIGETSRELATTAQNTLISLGNCEIPLNLAKSCEIPQTGPEGRICFQTRPLPETRKPRRWRRALSK